MNRTNCPGNSGPSGGGVTWNPNICGGNGGCNGNCHGKNHNSECW